LFLSLFEKCGLFGCENIVGINQLFGLDKNAVSLSAESD
jgi:hypothetical protein